MRHLLKALVAVAILSGLAAVFHPETPLPQAWNPIKPLGIDAPVTPLTNWKLRHALASDDLCHEVLAAGGAGFDKRAALEDSPACHITPRVTVRSVGVAKLRPVDTRCQTALRMAMWERHGLQAAALRHLGSEVREIRHFSSYNCRPIRSVSGQSNRMSSHATANALDVSGFVLADGRSVDLKRDWPGGEPKALFLRDAFKAACLWFPVALGPEFNALHADHFHLQTTGWGLCR